MTSVSIPAGLGPRLLLHLRTAPAAWAALGGGALAIAVYYQLPPDPQSIGYVAIGVASVTAVAIGTLRNLTREHRLAWYLFAAGLAGQVAGDMVFAAYEVGQHREPPFPGVADAFYLAGYPLLALGILVIVRRLGGPMTQAAVLDGAVVFLAVALVQWVFFIDPYNHQHAPAGTRLVEMAYPAMDALLLVGLAQLTAGRALRTRAYRLLILSLVLWVTADEAYTLGIGSYRGGSWIDGFWLGSYVCWAAAALDPSVAGLDLPERRATPRLSTPRVAVLAGALMMAPVILIVEKANHHRVHMSIGIFGVLISLAVLLRLAGLIRNVDRARMAERDARREAEVARRLLAFQNEQLRQVDRAKDEFVSNVSHELRTPLTSINGYVELLREVESDETKREYLSIIDRNAERLIVLVSDLLFAARLQDGRLALEKVEVDVSEMARRAVEEAAPRAVAAGVRLVLDAPGPAPVQGEPPRLAQLFDNLLSNAIKFTPEGGRVDVRVNREGEQVRIEVSDTGVGIAAADRERLFERFFRSPATHGREIQGTGLGLYISKAIVDAHGGRIGVESEEGKGTTFVVELPVT